MKGFILVNNEMHIEKARCKPSYEERLDGMLLAAENGWIYVPLGLGELVDELSRVEIYEGDE